MKKKKIFFLPLILLPSGSISDVLIDGVCNVYKICILNIKNIIYMNNIYVLSIILVLSILLTYAYMKYKKSNKVSKNIQKYVMINKIISIDSSYTIDGLDELSYDDVKEIHDELVNLSNYMNQLYELNDEQQFVIYNILINKFEDDTNI